MTKNKPSSYKIRGGKATSAEEEAEMEQISSADEYENRVGAYLKSIGKIEGGQARIEYPKRRAHIESGRELSGNRETGVVIIDLPVVTESSGSWIDATVALLAQHHELWGPIYHYPRTYFISRSTSGFHTDRTDGTDFERIIYVMPTDVSGLLTHVICLDIRHRRKDNEAYSACVYTRKRMGQPELLSTSNKISGGRIEGISADSFIKENAFSNNQEGRDLLVRLSMEYSCRAFARDPNRPKPTADLAISIAVRRIVEFNPRQTLSRRTDAVAQNKLFSLPGEQTSERLAAIFTGFVLKKRTTIRGRAEKALSEISSHLNRGSAEEPEDLPVAKECNENDVPLDDQEVIPTQRPRKSQVILDWEQDDDDDDDDPL